MGRSSSASAEQETRDDGFRAQVEHAASQHAPADTQPSLGLLKLIALT
jgi:hypothetical protein